VSVLFVFQRDGGTEGHGGARWREIVRLIGEKGSYKACERGLGSVAVVLAPCIFVLSMVI
jgi:hypothetical protein